MNSNSLSGRLAQLINSRAGRGLCLDYLCEQNPESTREQIRGALKYLVRSGQVICSGTNRNALYSSLAPNGSLGVSTDKSTTAASTPRGMKSAEVVLPQAVEIQWGPSPSGARGQWTGIDWSAAMSRPGCQDHLKHPSRRGHGLVMHGERMA